MRIFLAILFGLIGMIVAWLGVCFAIIAVAGFGDEGGTAMGAFFVYGPMAGLAGFVATVLLFRRFGIVRKPGTAADPVAGNAIPAAGPWRVSGTFTAVMLLLLAGVIAWAFAQP